MADDVSPSEIRNPGTNGMRNGYWTCDLHVHTPLSSCYESTQRHVSPAAIVAAAVRAGLDLIAITDHNGFGAIDQVREAARGKLIVLPGVELTTRGGHILGLFDREAPVAEMRRLLDEVGIPRSEEGEPAVETRLPTLDVLAAIQARGGLAIAAHVDRFPRGLMHSACDYSVRRSIHASEHLVALEITDPSSKTDWNEGRVRSYPKPYACIQASDAHAPAEIGRRPVYVDLASADLRGLRRALAEHARAIRFPHELAGMRA